VLGGLAGVSTENYKTQKFQNNIEAGQYLVIIDVNSKQTKSVKSIVAQQFPDIRKAGEDTIIVSPFESAA
jgi:23S rRNA pseudoU1915 N3-methylase RlmH